jgi:hypothetical protein
MPNGTLQRLAEAEQLAQQEAMMGADLAFKRLHQQIMFVLQLAMCQSRQPFHVLFSLRQRVQDGLAGDAHHITENGSQFDIGLFQQFLDAIDQTGSFFHEADARPSQITQVLLLWTGHKTGPE